MIRKIIKKIICILLIPLIILSIYLLFITITDYKPKAVEPVVISTKNDILLKKGTNFSVLTFNVGYCGLDKEQDFFMEGGKGSTSQSKVKTVNNLKNISDFIRIKNPSIVLLQELDIKSRRSFNINEYDYMENGLLDHNSAFTYNYRVPWILVPLKNPIGWVNSGIATFSQFKISQALRYKLPGTEKWPRQLMDLDRCFMEIRIPTVEAKELVLINIHLSAYDKGGKVRKQQLQFLKDYISKEYNKGNYVIVGGDWNHQIPGTDPQKFTSKELWPNWLQKIPDDFKPNGFKWAADPDVPSTRSDAMPYLEGKNFRAVIDGFLVSDNVDVESVKGYELNFENSDHNPVEGIFRLQ